MDRAQGLTANETGRHTGMVPEQNISSSDLSWPEDEGQGGGHSLCRAFTLRFLDRGDGLEHPQWQEGTGWGAGQAA